METRRIVTIAVSLGAAAALLVALMPRNAKFPYEYKKGQEWQHETLYSQFDFPLDKTDSQILEDRMNLSTVVPYFRYSQDIVDRNVAAARSMDLGVLSVPVVSELKSIYDKGVVGDDGVKVDGYDEIPEVIYVQRDKRAVKCPSSEVRTISAARAKFRDDIESLNLEVNVDSVFKADGVYGLIVPNLVYDSGTTAVMSSKAENAVSTTSGFVSTGEKIVSKGEVVTSEIALMLDSYRKEYEANLGYSGPVFLYWLGNSMIAIVLVLLFFFAIYFTSPSILKSNNRFFYVLMVYLMSAAGALLLSNTDVYTYCIAPFALAALFLQAFFRPKVIVSLYTVSLVPMLLFAPSGAALFVVYLVSGLVASYCFRTLGKGWKQFLTAFIMYAVQSFTMTGLYLTDLVDIKGVWYLEYFFAGALITVAAYTLVSLFERVFNLVSNTRLADLCDSSNTLIRDLELKAPGTFQHSLQVMNMADAVARALDVNPVLVKAGALYHDIGKMNNPLCFVENESLLPKADGERYHDSLTPAESSHDIVRHVTDGLELAQKHHLPEVLTDFIRTHHGTTHTGYFYSKFLSEGGSPAMEGEFAYPGPKPATKEQVILMLCDSIEAASRSLKEFTPEAYSAFVDKIISGKVAAGQLDESDISLKELSILTSTVKTYLAQMHHGRIAYPEQKIRFKKRR